VDRESDSLEFGQSGDGIPVEGTVLARVQTHHGSHPGGAGLIPGSKRPQPGVNHVFPPCAEVKERVQLYEGWNFNSGNYLFTTDTK